MAKVTGPALALGAGGTIGDALTFQKKGKGHAVYAYEKHKDAGSGLQLTQRARIGQLVTDWQNLSAVWKNAWELSAKAAGYHGTGYHYFMHKGGAGVPPPFVPGAFYILKEDGGKILQESGYGILTEAA